MIRGLMARRSELPFPRIEREEEPWWGQLLAWRVRPCGSGGMQRRWLPWCGRQRLESLEYRSDREGD